MSFCLNMKKEIKKGEAWRRGYMQGFNEGRINTLKECLKDIESYQVPMGFGSASGGIGIGAVKEYLRCEIEKHKQTNAREAVEG